MKRRMIAQVLELREQNRQQRLQVLRWMLAHQGGAEPAGAGYQETGTAR